MKRVRTFLSNLLEDTAKNEKKWYGESHITLAKAEVGQSFKGHGFYITFQKDTSCDEKGSLIDTVQYAITEICGYSTQLSTAGGTSDGRFIAPTGAQLVELGPVNATIHKVDECVKISDLEKLTDVYQAILKRMGSAL